MKINKKKLLDRKGMKVFFLFGAILSIALVTGLVLDYFGQINQNPNVVQAVELSDSSGIINSIFTEGSVDLVSGDTLVSNVYTLTNNADTPRDVNLVTTYNPNDVEEITTSYYELETLEVTQNMEKIWCGEPCEDLIIGEPLTVSVNYENGYVVFKATPPSDYTAETSLTTFTFDVDSDGIADFQVQYDGNGWIYSEVDEDGLVWLKDTTGWQNVPSEFITEFISREFTLKVPMSVLGGLGSTYKFGVQTNEGSPTWYQTFYPNTWNLWSTEENPSDNTVSANYKDMTLGTELVGSFLVEDSLSFVVVNEFNDLSDGFNGIITTEVLPA